MTTHDNKRLTASCCPVMAYSPNSFKDNALQKSPWRVPPSPLLINSLQCAAITVKPQQLLGFFFGLPCYREALGKGRLSSIDLTDSHELSPAPATKCPEAAVCSAAEEFVRTAFPEISGNFRTAEYRSDWLA